MHTKLDPWSSSDITDYSKLFEEFGISPFENLLPEIPSPHMYMRRRVIFGHRDYEQIAEAMRTGAPFSVMDGFMPSGKVHLGHKMVMDQIIWHQEKGASCLCWNCGQRSIFGTRIFLAEMQGNRGRRIHIKPYSSRFQARWPYLFPVRL